MLLQQSDRGGVLSVALPPRSGAWKGVKLGGFLAARRADVRLAALLAMCWGVWVSRCGAGAGRTGFFYCCQLERVLQRARW